MVRRWHRVSPERGGAGTILAKPADQPFQGVDAGVARYHDIRCGDVLPQQIFGIGFDRRKMQPRDPGDQAAIDLLRPWRIDIPGSQAGFDMRHWNFLIERGERGRERRGGVALHEEPIGPMDDQLPLHRLQHRVVRSVSVCRSVITASSAPATIPNKARMSRQRSPCCPVL